LGAGARDARAGGLAMCAVGCCAGGGGGLGGAPIEIDAGEPIVEALFGEAPSRIVASAAPSDVAEIERRAAAAGGTVRRLGTAGAGRLLPARDGGPPANSSNRGRWPRGARGVGASAR